MRVMVLIKASKESEAEQRSGADMQKMLEEMGRYNDELVKAGIFVAADGLKPSSYGARLRITQTERTFVDGPFAETKELVAGYWIWEVKSLEEAKEWARRVPNPLPGQEPAELELRPFYEMSEVEQMLAK